MRVRVLFFGILKELAGKSVDVIDVPRDSSVRDVLALYESRIPRLTESLPSLALAVNQQYAGPGTRLAPDDEVALLPPVSGGAPAAAGGPLVGNPGRCARILRNPIDTQQTLSNL